MEKPTKIGIIAGGGGAPHQLIATCRKLGRPFFVFCLEGQADADLASDDPHIWISLGACVKLKAQVGEQGITDIVMIGRVRRPSLKELKPDWLALKLLAKVGLNSLGDDGLLRAVGKALEVETGVRLVGVQDVFTDLLTPEGVLTALRPTPQDEADIARGIDVATTLGRLDVGQAVVVQQGLVLGVEAIEGTDALVLRSGSLKREGGGGVLVKRAKPQQDRRLDLPTIGPDTIKALATAGLRGVAVQAGQSLLIDREKTITLADEKGIFLLGALMEETLL